MPVKDIKNFHLDLLPVIDGPPKQPKELYAQACANDDITIKSWRPTWIKHYKENHEKFGPFRERSIGKLHNCFYRQPCIIAGCGASLAENVKQLADRKGIPFISPLHNFAFLEDNNAHADFYVTLDSGKIVVPDMSEGGKNPPEYYWGKTEGHTLLAYCATDPEVLEKWQGEIYFFNSVIPAEDIRVEQEKTEVFRTFISSGGNVTGASTYIAKVVMGCNPIIWVGCNYAFSYDRRFTPWPQKTDMGNVVRAIDIYGNSVPSWQSYLNFAAFFQWLATTIPGIYINASGEGVLGAFPQGLMKQIIQLPLNYVIEMYNMSNEATVRLGPEEQKLDMKEVFRNPDFLLPKINKPFCMY